jgi:glycosyltransferase involved in cell wall biosynthesis
VWVFAPRVQKTVEGAKLVDETLRVGGIKLPIRDIGPYPPRYLHDVSVARALRRLAGSIDLVHCWPASSIRTMKTARRLGIMSFLERPNTHTRFAFEVVRKEYEKLKIEMPGSETHAFDAARLAQEESEYAMADRLACPSDFVVRSFLDLDYPASRLARIQYGCDPQVFHARGRTTTDAGGVEFLFAARCEPRKGLHYALKAWLASEASKTGKLHICGVYSPNYREILEDQLRHPSIVDHGFTEDIPSMMRRCDALILPSIEEGSALVTYEARACGCVLLVSDATGAPCTHMETGLVHRPGDVETLRQHIDLVASDRKLLAELRRKSLEAAHEVTWEHAGTLLEKAYRDALATAPGAA